MERANGLILAGLKPRLYEELADYGSKWIEELSKVVWGLRTQISRATGYSPFFLVYRSEAVLPVDLIWMSPRIEQYDEGEAEHTRRLELDSIEEVRINATLQSAKYLQELRRHYNKNTQSRSLQVGDLALRRIQKNRRTPQTTQSMGRSFYHRKSHRTRHIQAHNWRRKRSQQYMAHQSATKILRIKQLKGKYVYKT